MADGVEAILGRRRGEQAAALETARHYATRVASEVSLVATVVFGSYAWGDFNTWSDIDVLVISDALPSDARARLDLSGATSQAPCRRWAGPSPSTSPDGPGATPSPSKPRRLGSP